MDLHQLSSHSKPPLVFSDLPLEIVERILFLATTNTRNNSIISLLLVCRLFHEAGIQNLYRDLYINDSRSAEMFTRLWKGRNEDPSAMRKLSATTKIQTTWKSYPVGVMLEDAAGAKVLPNLQELDVEVDDHAVHGTMEFFNFLGLAKPVILTWRSQWDTPSVFCVCASQFQVFFSNVKILRIDGWPLLDILRPPKSNRDTDLASNMDSPSASVCPLSQLSDLICPLQRHLEHLFVIWDVRAATQYAYWWDEIAPLWTTKLPNLKTITFGCDYSWAKSRVLLEKNLATLPKGVEVRIHLENDKTKSTPSQDEVFRQIVNGNWDFEDPIELPEPESE